MLRRAGALLAMTRGNEQPLPDVIASERSERGNLKLVCDTPAASHPYLAMTSRAGALQ